MENIIRIAVQKSGRLSEDSLSLIKECGIKFYNGTTQIMGFNQTLGYGFPQTNISQYNFTINQGNYTNGYLPNAEPITFKLNGTYALDDGMEENEEFVLMLMMIITILTTILLVGLVGLTRAQWKKRVKKKSERETKSLPIKTT